MYTSDLATVSRSQFIIYTQSWVYIILYKRWNVPNNECNLLTKHIDSLQMTIQTGGSTNIESKQTFPLAEMSEHLYQQLRLILPYG